MNDRPAENHVTVNTKDPSMKKISPLTRIVDLFLRGDVAILLIILSLTFGAVALYLTPREEEPQISVPMVDVMVSVPGLSANEVERTVTTRLEKMVNQIDGVEYVYSMSRPGACVITVRFYVGEDREDSILKLYNKIHSNIDRAPAAVTGWVIKPVEVDDVPIVDLALWSDRPERYDDHQLRRLAEQFQNELQAIPDTNQVEVIGGRPRTLLVELDPVRLASRRTSVKQVADAIRAGNLNVTAGEFDQQNRSFTVEAGTFLRDSHDLEELVVRVFNGRPVYLKNVATIHDGPAEVDGYTWIGFGPADTENGSGVSPGDLYPAVHIAVAKQKGANAVWVADAVEERMHELARELLPEGVFFRVTRNYGETANEKVNELVESLVIAVLTVIGLIGLVIGWRPALVVALAIPVCYSITLFVNLLAGYTINRVTLFALILSLGLLVDDPITDVENIARYFAMRILPPRESVLRAIQEVRPALILSTLAIIASFLPLMFITGMMGPYMAPMAMNVPLTVLVSTIVAFLITPWLSMVALRKIHGKRQEGEAFDLRKQPLYRISKAMICPVLDRRWLSWSMLGGVALLLFSAMLLPAFRLVPLKMLPYDNKNEFQIVIDLPENATLEQTDLVARELSDYLMGVAEVRDVSLFSGTASPMDFNGMVRHYFLREAANLGDIRVNLAPKELRAQQSHGLTLRIRDELTKIAARHDAKIKLVEVPPGPPVLATITAEVYGPQEATYEQIIAAAEKVERRMAEEPGLVDVDSSAESNRPKWVFETDKPKAALSGVSTETLAETLNVILDGRTVTSIYPQGEVNPLPIRLHVNRSLRSAVDDLREIYAVGDEGQLVQIGSLGKFIEKPADQTIYHKNLRRVVFVYAETAGRPPADAILDMQFDQLPDGTKPGEPVPRPVESRTWFSPGGGVTWSLPPGYFAEWAGEGEWKITLDVFRDLGLAFGTALVGIFIILMFQTGSRMLPLVIMLAIPLTLIGIMPGFWLLNVLVDYPIAGYPNPVFLTATAMIGMIALAGIVVRNSVVLIDFIHHAQAEGFELREAIVRSVAVRTRPILATAGTTLLGNWVITLDPIFSGLAWAIIFGILTSTLFTLIVIPVVYWLLYGKSDQQPSEA